MSVAVKEVIETVKDVAVTGMLNAVTVGGVISGSVTVIDALLLADTLPAASFAQAYSVLAPAVAKV